LAASSTSAYPALTVATRTWDGTPEGTPPFGYYGRSLRGQVGTVSEPSLSTGALVIVNPRVPPLA
jgi:hypothetical protein